MRVLMRLRLPAALMGALALVLVGCGGGGGTPDASTAEDDFIVVQEIPTNRQEVGSFLNEVDGRIQLEFSTNLDASSILDPTNPFNGLSSELNMLDSNLIRVAGTPQVSGRYFRFIPPSTGLPPQQYTVTVSDGVHSAGGQSLVGGEYYCSFTVDQDIYAPIIRRTYPVPNQKGVATDSTITFVFNEPLDPSSVNSQTIVVQDGGTIPAATVAGEVFLRKNGFVVEFVPDPATQLPPSTTIVVTVQGGNGGIADETAGLPFVGDPTDNNQYKFQFDTVVSNDPLTQFARASLYFSDYTSVGDLDIGTYVGTSCVTPDGLPGVIPNSRTEIGNPTEIVLDPRVNGNGDTFIYIVDRSSQTVAVVNTLNMHLVGRIAASGPRGVGIHPSGNWMYISEYGSDSVGTFDLLSAQPGTDLWDSTQDPIFGSAVRLVTTPVGRGPLGAAHAPGSATFFVVNNLEGSCTVLNDSDSSVWKTWQTGSNPQDVNVSVVFTIGYFALVTNLGDTNDPGSCSLWWDSYPEVQQWRVTGLQNPKGMAYDQGTNWYVANSGGDTVSVVQIQIQGGTVVPAIISTYKVGGGPQNVALDPVNVTFGFSSDRASGTVTVFDVSNVNSNWPTMNVPGVAYLAGLLSQ